MLAEIIRYTSRRSNYEDCPEDVPYLIRALDAILDPQRTMTDGKVLNVPDHIEQLVLNHFRTHKADSLYPAELKTFGNWSVDWPFEHEIGWDIECA
jgi:hypothetical protein